MFKRPLKTVAIIAVVLFFSSAAYAVPFTLNDANGGQAYNSFTLESDNDDFGATGSMTYDYTLDTGLYANADRIDTNWGFFNPPRWLPPWIGRLPWFPIFPWRPIGGGGDAPAPVPEPATMLLLGTGLIGLAAIGRKKLRR